MIYCMTNLWEEFYGPNAGYIIELYERYRQDPGSVDRQTREFFAANPPPAEVVTGTSAEETPAAGGSVQAAPSAPSLNPLKIAGAQALAESIRHYGHWAAQLDPLGSRPVDDPALRLETYGLTEADLRRIPAGVVGGAVGERAVLEGAAAWDAIEALRKIYSTTVGFDFLQVRNPEEREWLREAAETGRFSVEHDPLDAEGLLRRLTQVEAFEQFLQRSFVGKTRFSIEGVDMLIPLLDEVIAGAAHSGIGNILLGMAHRGRLNVLAHVLNKPIDQILAEFKDPLRRRVLQSEPDGERSGARSEIAWQGDVKYHAGAQFTLPGKNGAQANNSEQPEAVHVTIQMAPNPSHLEAVNPVVEGMARAAGTRADQPGPAVFDPTVTLPILIHGDAAFTGQGVVAETLNMYRLHGYETGGTIHIIANNQVGFTAEGYESRSTLFASDLAKGYRIPIIHANADDPEGVIMAARLAFAYRERFQNDFLIDLIGYRRLGHNEGDEPAFTQPRMYQAITQHPSVRKLWAGVLVQRGVVAADLPEQIYQEQLNALQSALEKLDPNALQEPIPPAPPAGAARKVKTAVPAETLRELNQSLLQVPEGFTVHPRLARIRQRREKMLDEAAEGASSGVASIDWPSIDWAAAEDLAFASILADGTPIRLTGQDTERGTFSHRHAVLHDAATGATYIPLQSIPQARASFEIHNSPLSEYAALGFEFGYNVQALDRLVIWEAQYGDFINNAQAVVDEFIVSARDKWGQLPALVILLPHAYEGQGPDHSSGRLERFLNLAADNNLRVANCTTAANYFHLLRRQAALLEVDRLPLVVMTPKSLLRHPLVSSPLRAFSEGGWQPIIDRQGPPGRAAGETAPALPPAEEVHRLVLCSGKVYVDLITSEIQPQHPEVGIVRVEQLAPFPLQAVKDLLERYPALEEVLWVQEEPENMGAWDSVRPYLEESIDGRASLRVVARPRSASPAEGSNNLHTFNQRRLVEQAFEDKGSNRESVPRQKVVAHLHD
jgi:2-oxoglutarate dehydrogenase E1 component